MNRRHFIELFSGPSASSPGAFSGPSSRDNLDASAPPRHLSRPTTWGHYRCVKPRERGGASVLPGFSPSTRGNPLIQCNKLRTNGIKEYCCGTAVDKIIATPSESVPRKGGHCSTENRFFFTAAIPLFRNRFCRKTHFHFGSKNHGPVKGLLG